MIRFTIEGEMAQKGNSRRIVTNRMSLKPMIIKSAKALGWWHSATLQLLENGLMLMDVEGISAMYTGPLRLTALCFYASERPDLDASTLKDVLQSRYTGRGKKRKRCVIGVYENDRQVREEHYYHHIDAQRPRVEVTIETLSALAASALTR